MRLPDWEPRLDAVLNQWGQQQFEWGRWDCALLAADCIEALTGTDPAAAFRGRYSTKQGAAAALRKYGAGTLKATLDAATDGQIPPALAQRGDVVMFQGNAGVCMGRMSLFIGEGLEQVPTLDCETAWGVGHG
jgi:hypothetical protein